MSENKIEFKIIKDASGKHVDLTGMSIKATQSLVTLMTSLTNILNECTNGQSVKIQLVKGSAKLIASASENIIKEVYKGFDEIVENKSTNKILVENWQSIQNLIKANGLQYEANFYTRSIKTPVLEKIRSSKQFKVRTTRKRVSSDTDLIFIKGRLIEVGGKRPNIHIIADGDEKFTVSCDERQAINVNKFLYQSVMLSVWRTKKNNGIVHYAFCDFYIDANSYNQFSKFIADFNDKEEVESLIDLHQTLRGFIEIKDFGNLRKALRLFTHESLDVSSLKTILVITKSLKDQVEISELRQSLKAILESKIGALV